MPATVENLPTYVEPMRCLPAPSVPLGDGWLYEIEWQGRRVIGCKLGRAAHVISAAGRCLDEEYPEMVAALRALNCRSAIVDGEIVVWDENGRPAREETTKRRRDACVLQMAVFDLMMLEGRDLTDKPLILRRAALNSILPPEGDSMICFSRELQGQADQLLSRAHELHISGIVAKRRDSVYEFGGRSGSWLLCRAEMEGIFVVGGYIPGDDAFEELIIGEPAERGLRFVARLRAGFMPASRGTVFSALGQCAEEPCPFANLPDWDDDPAVRMLDAEDMTQCRWIAPHVSVEVAFSGRTIQGKLRQPRFEGLAQG